MTLRSFQCVLRYHKLERKQGYEQFYAEMLLFLPWRNEIEELQSENPEGCIEKSKNIMTIWKPY